MVARWRPWSFRIRWLNLSLLTSPSNRRQRAPHVCGASKPSQFCRPGFFLTAAYPKVNFASGGKSFHLSVTSGIFVIVNASDARWSREIRHMKTFAATLEGRVIVIAQSQAPRGCHQLFFSEAR